MKRNMIIATAIFVAFGLNLIFTVLVHDDLSTQIQKVPTNVTEKYYVTKSELENWQRKGESEKIIQDGAVELEQIELKNGDKIWELKE